MRRFAQTSLVILAAAALLLAAPAGALACPFCSAPSLTLSQQVAESDAVVLVKWVGGTKPVRSESGEVSTDRQPASTVFEVVQIVKAPGGTLKEAEKITLPLYTAANQGDLFVLMGTRGTGIEWTTPLEVTKDGFKYIAAAPAPDLPAEKRLSYFLNYLEHPDQLVANDAYGEFANAPYEDIVKLKDEMPREKIREWVVSPDTNVARLGLYGLFIGLCGTQEDAKLIEKKIAEPTQDFRLGIDGIMSGYLVLMGEKGLELIERTKLNPGKDEKVPFSETYAAMQALRFMWTYGEGKIEKERLRESMRLLLDRPELADLVIADLARWQDWSVQDRLMEIYGKEGYDIPSIKRAIVRYFLVASKDDQKDQEGNDQAQVASAKKHLDTLRERDPNTVKEAERFFFIR